MEEPGDRLSGHRSLPAEIQRASRDWEEKNVAVEDSWASRIRQALEIYDYPQAGELLRRALRDLPANPGLLELSAN